MADQPIVGHEPLQFDANPQPLTVNYARRQMPMHLVAEYELEALAASGNSIFFVVFGASFGAFASFVSVLVSTPVQNAKTNAVFIALTVLFGMLSVVFGALGWRDFQHSKKKLADLTGRN